MDSGFAFTQARVVDSGSPIACADRLGQAFVLGLRTLGSSMPREPLAKRLAPNSNRLAVSFVRREPSWMAESLQNPLSPPEARLENLIEHQARVTQQQGERPMWSGYQAVSNYPHSTVGSRTSNQVRTNPRTGRFYVWLVSRRRPTAIVEFGTAFGVSGMYWLAGLEECKAGHLFTFEPNSDWAALAKTNLDAISDRYTLSNGIFEELAGPVLGQTPVDIAFVDAIHTSEFVNAQFEVLKRHMAPGGLVLFDDINFSADMRACWRGLAVRPEVVASATIGTRIGMVELAR